MMATTRDRGFTIVELLIVIVVIAILAAITVVAFTGIQNRARASNASSALNQANKKLAEYIVDNTGYPASLSTIGLANTGDVSYQYTFNNSVSPATYCVTATSGTVSYKASSTSTTPTSGGCAGHGVGGNPAIINIATNPSSETNSTGWAVWYANGTGTFTRPTTGGYTGSAYMRATWSTASTVGTGGIYFGTSAQAVQVGTTYNLSGYVRSNVSKPIRASIEWYSSASARMGDTYGTTVTINPNTWTRLSVSGPAPAGTSWARVTFYATGPAWNPSETLDVDGVMITEGSTLYNYADGASTNWDWTGTPHASTSTGPEL